MSRKLFLGLFLAAWLAVPLSAQDGPKKGEKKEGPDVGDVAPNFKATLLGSDEEVELAEILKREKKPVVLIFGSST